MANDKRGQLFIRTRNETLSVVAMCVCNEDCSDRWNQSLRTVHHLDNNRGSLPPITDPDERLHIDSLGVIRLVAFLETDLGIRVEDEELIVENFETLRKLGELIMSKSKAVEAPHRPTPSPDELSR